MGMRTSKYSQEQVIGFLRQAEAGLPINEVSHKHGFSDASFFKWRSKDVGMHASAAKWQVPVLIGGGSPEHPHR